MQQRNYELNPLTEQEKALIDRHTTVDHADHDALLGMRTFRPEQDVELQKPTTPALQEIITTLPQRTDDDPLLDQRIDEPAPPIDWETVKSAVPMGVLGLSAASALLFVVLPTVASFHNAGKFPLLENLSWWPIITALIGIGWTAWQNGDNGKAVLFGGDAIIISTWY